MRIGIDISQIVFEGTGVATYTRNLVENLLKIDDKNRYVFFGASLRRSQSLRDFAYSPKTILPIPPAGLSLLWNDWHIFPVENFIGMVDVFHSSDWTQPPTKAKKVTTIHDLIVYKSPESSHPKIIETQQKRLEWIRKECDLIIVDSQSTQMDCQEILGIPREKTRVIYLAAAEEFAKFNSQSRAEKEQQIESVKEKFNLKKKYILVVGTREPRKNLDRLIAAYQKLPNHDVELVVIGKYGWGNRETNKNVRLLGLVFQDNLPAIYAGAELFAYPSLYEGFGIPILEAMSVGCPVLTSDCSSMPEVGGKAALYVDPLSISSLTAKLEEILAFSSEARKRIIDQGYLQAKKFSWEKTAKETMDVYMELNHMHD